MKKFAVCYQASFQELKHVKTLTTAAMLMAVSVVLGYFTIEAGPYLKIGFGGVVSLSTTSSVRWLERSMAESWTWSNMS